jgi:hypothetical protein
MGLPLGLSLDMNEDDAIAEEDDDDAFNPFSEKALPPAGMSDFVRVFSSVT